MMETIKEVQAQAIWPYKLLAVLACMLGLLLAGYLFGVKTSAPQPENTAPAAAQSQPDGSLILARVPEAKPAKAPHKIPKGTTEERRVSIQLKPPAFESPAGCECEPAPLDVNLSLVREDGKGGGRRVVASSPQGQILAGLDVPIEPALMPPEAHPWAAGISYDPLSKSPGVWVERDLGRIRLGVEALRDASGKLQGRLRAGWSW